MSRKHNKQKMLAVSLIDIIIPVMDMADMLINCLKSIPDAARDLSYQIIIVDNGSQPEELKKYRGSLHTTIAGLMATTVWESSCLPLRHFFSSPGCRPLGLKGSGDSMKICAGFF